jgi:hypothetical protein
MSVSFVENAPFYHDDFRRHGMRSARANAPRPARSSFEARTFASAQDIAFSTRSSARSRASPSVLAETCQALFAIRCDLLLSASRTDGAMVSAHDTCRDRS